MDRIKDQSNKVGQLLFSADTGTTYRQALTLTWAIIREIGVLLWLVICLVLVGGEWLWQTAIRLGQQGRSWYEDLKTPKAKPPKSASAIGQSILTSLNTGTGAILYQAKQQLGMDALPAASPSPQAAPQTSTAADAAATAAGTQPPNIPAVPTTTSVPASKVTASPETTPDQPGT